MIMFKLCRMGNKTTTTRIPYAQINILNCFFFDKVVKKVKLSLVRSLKQIIIWSVKIVENKKKTFVYQEAIIQAFNTSLFT